MQRIVFVDNLFPQVLDKLGLAAIFNHTRVMRQDFFGYNYGLVDQDGTLLPVCLVHHSETVLLHFNI